MTELYSAGLILERQEKKSLGGSHFHCEVFDYSAKNKHMVQSN
jgi:hypothetical protein